MTCGKTHSVLLVGFADDLKLIGIRGQDTQNDLLLINRWIKLNLMELNTEKCKVFNFKTSHYSKHDYYINNTKLESSDYERDLNIIVDCKLSFSYHVSNILKRAYLMANWIFKIFLV